MKSIIIYNSETGFTKKYAKMLSESIQAECVPLKSAKKMNLSDYDTVVFGSWCCAGGIKELDWFKDKIPSLSNKKLAVFAVGASPIDNPELKPAMDKIFSDPIWDNVMTSYCQGGICYEKMPASSKLLMNMFLFSLKAKKNPTEMEKSMSEHLATSYDISDIKYLDPIISYINA